jgi:peptidoglycan hydrolase CwlO-like protein
MLIEILILLFIIIIFYEIFNDVFSKRLGIYENFASSSKLPNQNNKDVQQLQKDFGNQDVLINDINSKLSKISNNINALNEQIKSKSGADLSKYNEITEGAEVDINNTENI